MLSRPFRFRLISLLLSAVCAQAFADPPQIPIPAVDAAPAEAPVGKKPASAKDAVDMQDIRSFAAVYSLVKQAYVENVDDHQLMQAAIRGLLAGLDPHSEYLDRKQIDDLTEDTTGSYNGLGIEVVQMRRHVARRRADRRIAGRARRREGRRHHRAHRRQDRAVRRSRRRGRASARQGRLGNHAQRRARRPDRSDRHQAQARSHPRRQRARAHARARLRVCSRQPVPGRHRRAAAQAHRPPAEGQQGAAARARAGSAQQSGRTAHRRPSKSATSSSTTASS